MARRPTKRSPRGAKNGPALEGPPARVPRVEAAPAVLSDVAPLHQQYQERMLELTPEAPFQYGERVLPRTWEQYMQDWQSRRRRPQWPGPVG